MPVEYKRQAFLIEHRKFGLGVFAGKLPDDEAAAAEIVRLVNRGTEAAKPYFDWRAEQAAKDSKLNVVNRSSELFERFQFFLEQYNTRRKKADERAGEKIKKQIKGGYSVEYPAFRLCREAKWFALSAIESLYSWTEHIFIHIAILNGSCATGEDVANLAGTEWGGKFRAALDINDPDTKRFYDELLIVRRQLRNFLAHGSFGKDGEAFQFHSGAGDVPMLLPHSRDRSSFRFGQGVDFVDEQAIALIRDFIEHLWSGPRAPAKIYIQDYRLPLILTNVKNGEYARAMASSEKMAEYALYLAELTDRHANMDF